MISFPSSLWNMRIYFIYPAHLRMMDTELVRVHGLNKEWSWSAEIPKLGPRIYRKINTCNHPFLDILLVTLHCLIQTLNLVHLNPNMTSGRKYSQDEEKLYFTTSGLTHISVFLGNSCPHKMHFLYLLLSADKHASISPNKDVGFTPLLLACCCTFICTPFQDALSHDLTLYECLYV